MPTSKIKMSKQKEISAEFPFESKYVKIFESNIHYIDQGKGDPILFIHGNPTSSYLWRNIIPYVSKGNRVIAIDLIGMGKSDKPDIGYRFVDHVRYLDAFIKKMELKNITLVLHDWGSSLGFNYAANNEGNIKGIAFMEALIKPKTWDEFPADLKQTLQKFRSDGVGKELLMTQNVFVEQVLPGLIVRKLCEKEMNRYREPYITEQSRKPVWMWPNQLPIDGEPSDVHKITVNYNQWLQETEIPKILFYATPGAFVSESLVEWSIQNMKNLQTVDVGAGLHFIQEDNPHKIGEELSKWHDAMCCALD